MSLRYAQPISSEAACSIVGDLASPDFAIAEKDCDARATVDCFTNHVAADVLRAAIDPRGQRAKELDLLGAQPNATVAGFRAFSELLCQFKRLHACHAHILCHSLKYSNRLPA